MSMIRAILFGALSLSAALTAAQTYTITDLGEAMGGGTAVNIQGDVVGNNTSRAFLWSSSSGRSNLRPLSGSGQTDAYAINSYSVIAGVSQFPAGGGHAVLWTNGKVEDLGALPGAQWSWANGVNNESDVVGLSEVGNPPVSVAIIWSKTRGMKNLGTLPGGRFSAANGINDFGVVVGESETAGNTSVPIFWTEATGMQPLLTLSGGGGSGARAINDLGQIVGWSGCGTSCEHAVLWSSTTSSAQDLGVLTGTSNSGASSINNHGRVVGTAWDTSSNFVPFVWSQTSGMQNLNSLIPPNSGWLLLSASAINNNGQITGQGIIHAQTHAFLLTPQ